MTIQNYLDRLYGLIWTPKGVAKRYTKEVFVQRYRMLDLSEPNPESGNIDKIAKHYNIKEYSSLVDLMNQLYAKFAGNPEVGETYIDLVTIIHNADKSIVTKQLNSACDMSGFVQSKKYYDQLDRSLNPQTYEIKRKVNKNYFDQKMFVIVKLNTRMMQKLYAQFLSLGKFGMKCSMLANNLTLRFLRAALSPQKNTINQAPSDKRIATSAS